MKTTFDPELGRTYSLDRSDSWPASVHQFDVRSVWAIRAALASGRPLLVRGEPGVGKSQLARAAAVVLQVPFLYQVINARCECGDLLYSYDAVSRLAQAQVAGAGAARKAVHWEEQLDEVRFIKPGVLWWAFDWQSARQQSARYYRPGPEPARPKDWSPEQGCVLLIDEIDKADSDLPNGLLESLGNTGFQVPQAGCSVLLPAGAAPPLVIITTNEERELPAAFLRRCLVLQIKLPEAEGELIKFLVHRARAHFGDRVASEAVYHEAARQLLEDRQSTQGAGLARPGPAEYLDMMCALAELYPREAGVSAKAQENAQLEALKQIHEFALRKNPEGV